MIPGVEFTDDVDPTALATFILAAITLVTVIVGGIALRRTRSEIDLSRQEVEEAHRPVLIPVNDENQTLRVAGVTTEPRAKPLYQENNRVVVPIKNIGSGPALNIIVFVRPVNDAGQISEAWGDRWHTKRVLGLGVGELMPVVVYVPGLGDVPNFQLALSYVDVASKTWQTRADYTKRGDGSYTTMSIASTTEFAEIDQARQLAENQSDGAS